jgi:hypothetical protein
MLIRPQLAQALLRWREVGAAAVCGLSGLWLIWLGGWILQPLGAAILLSGVGWGMTAMRRMRFARAVAAPGVVEVDEGQIGYLGPAFGGYIALSELTELRLIDLHGQRHWRLRQADGQVLLIPVAASGAEQLFDAFATLPGADMARLASAIDAAPGLVPIWTRRLGVGCSRIVMVPRPRFAAAVLTWPAPPVTSCTSDRPSSRGFPCPFPSPAAGRSKASRSLPT